MTKEYAKLVRLVRYFKLVRESVTVNLKLPLDKEYALISYRK